MPQLTTAPSHTTCLRRLDLGDAPVVDPGTVTVSSPMEVQDREIILLHTITDTGEVHSFPLVPEQVTIEESESPAAAFVLKHTGGRLRISQVTLYLPDPASLA